MENKTQKRVESRNRKTREGKGEEAKQSTRRKNNNRETENARRVQTITGAASAKEE